MGRMHVNVFAQHGFYTEFHNALFDVVLPAIPPNAWKILCAVLRQTKGWQRNTVGLNIHQLMRLTGIGSEHTVQKALQDLRDFKQEGRLIPLLTEHKTNQWEPRTYSLNRAAKLAWQPVAESATEPVAESATEPVAESATEPVAESATEPVAESATEPVAESATLSIKRNNKRNNKRNKQQQQTDKEQKLAAAAANPSAPHSSKHEFKVVSSYVRENRQTAKNPGGLARALWKSGEDDDLIDIWLSIVTEQKAKQQKQENQEKMANDFFDSLNSHQYEMRFTAAKFEFRQRFPILEDSDFIEIDYTGNIEQIMFELFLAEENALNHQAAA